MARSKIITIQPYRGDRRKVRYIDLDINDDFLDMMGGIPFKVFPSEMALGYYGHARGGECLALIRFNSQTIYRFYKKKLIEVGLRQCSVCKKVKRLEEFTFRSSTGFYSSRCKKCSAELVAEIKSKNKDHYRDVARRSYERTYREKHPLTERVCPECRIKFTPRRNNQVYCTEKCRQKARRRRKNERLSLEEKEERKQKNTEWKRNQYYREHLSMEKSCPECGKKFMSSDGRKVYCSKKCADKARWKRMKAKKARSKALN